MERESRGRGRGHSDRGRGGRGDGGRGRGYSDRGRDEGGRGGGRGGFKGPEYPQIPKDRRIKLDTNMFPVKLETNNNNNNKLNEVERYEVGFFTLTGAPKTMAQSKRLKRLVMLELSKQFVDKTPFAYDGMSILYTLVPMEPVDRLKPPKEFFEQKDSSTIELSININKLEKDNEDPLVTEVEHLKLKSRTGSVQTSPFDPKGLHYVVDLPDTKRKEKPNAGKLVVQLRRTENNITEESSVQMLQIAAQFACYVLRSDSIIRGSNVYHNDKRRQLQSERCISDLMLFTGIFQSFRKAKIGLVLNVDVCYFVALGAFNVKKWFDIRAEKEGFRSLGEAFNDSKFCDMLKKEIRGMEVKTKYGVGRKYKIESIDFKQNAKNTMLEVPVDSKNNNNNKPTTKRMSVLDYMKVKYGKEVANIDDSLPLLIVKKKSATDAPTYILADLCSFTDAQRRRSILSAEERALMIDFTRTQPGERFKIISGLAHDVVTNDYLKRFPITVLEDKPISTTANVLDNKDLEFRQNAKTRPDQRGGWNFRDRQLHTSRVTSPASWALVYYPKFDSVVDDLVAQFVKVGDTTGLPVSDRPALIKANSNRPEDYEKATLSIENIKPAPHFVLIILPDSGGDRHDRVKHVCDLKLKIPSKCFISDGRKEPKDNVLANIIASINVKLAGINWTVNPQQMKNISPPSNNLCVLGLDVCHGALGDSGSSSNTDSSAVALCASLNQTFTHYHTAIRYQEARREVVMDIERMMLECLDAFEKRNKALPVDILFYRDGVGEGMYDLVRQYEITHIKKGIADLYKSRNKPNPRLTYVIVQKRNHLRTKWDFNNDTWNPPHGTAIQSDVVDNNTNNFYLYSHYAGQGTAKPTHYQVLEDGIGFKERLIDFTYALSHLHQGCPKTISLPVPVFYADMAAARISDYYDRALAVPNPIQIGFNV